MSDYQIDTDGRTVWVNAPNCVARICPISAEVMASSEWRLDAPPSWQRWVAAVYELHSIVVPEALRPAWSGRT